MAMKQAYDEAAIRRLADDLASALILPGADAFEIEAQYRGLARKLHKLGWRQAEETPAVTVAVQIQQANRAPAASEFKRGWLVWDVKDGKVSCRGFARGDSGAARLPSDQFPGAVMLATRLRIPNADYNEFADHVAGPVHDATCRGSL